MVDQCEALVFDFDGVIADTEPLHWESWAVLLSSYGIELGWDEYCRIGQGVSDMEIFEYFRARIPNPDLNRFVLKNRERKRMVVERSLQECPIAAETAQFMRSLDGYLLRLVTSSERADVEPILRAAQIQGIFDGMVFGGEASSPKPSPTPYFLIAERLGVKALIAFEDSQPGLESARAAGFRAVKVDRPSELSKTVRLALAQKF